MPRVGGNEVIFELAQSLRRKLGRDRGDSLIEEDDKVLEVMKGSRFFFRLFPPRKISLLFRTEEKLGSGGFGSVLRALPTKKGLDRIPGLDHGRSYALKQMRLRCALSDNGLILGSIGRGLSAERLLHLGGMLTEPSNDYVLRILAVIIEFPSHMYIVQELLGGPDMFDYLSATRSRFSEPQAIELSQQLLSALDFLHCRVGLVHRDVKPENLVFVSDPSGEATSGQIPLPPVKLIDFGLSLMLPGPVVDEASLSELIPVPLAGTPMYMAPEIWTGKLGPSSDVWSAGLVVFGALSLSLPFGLVGCRGKAARRILTAAELELAFPEKQWKDISEAAKAFIAAILQKDARLRPSAGALLRTSVWLGQSQPNVPSPKRAESGPMDLLEHRSSVLQSTADEHGSPLGIFEIVAAEASA